MKRRKLFKALLVVAGVLVVLGVALYLTLDSIVKAGIEKGGTWALGVNTRVEKVSVKLLRGRLTMDRFEIDNPPGCREPLLMKSGHWNIEVKPGSLFGDTIVLPKFEVDGLEVDIETRPGGTNVAEVMNHLKRLSSSGKKEGQRKVVIRSVVVRNVTARVRLLSALGDPSVREVTVPRIELKNVGSESSGGALVSEVTAQLFTAVIASVVVNGKGVLPVDFLKGLNSDVVGAAGVLGGNAPDLLGQVGGDFAKEFEKAGPPPAENAEKGAEKAIEGLFKKPKSGKK